MGWCQIPNLGAHKVRWVSRSEEDESLLSNFLILFSLVSVCLLSKSELWCSRKVGQSRWGVDDECCIKRIVVNTCLEPIPYSICILVENSQSSYSVSSTLANLDDCFCKRVLMQSSYGLPCPQNFLSISSQFHVFELNWDVCWVWAGLK